MVSQRERVGEGFLRSERGAPSAAKANGWAAQSTGFESAPRRAAQAPGGKPASAGFGGFRRAVYGSAGGGEGFASAAPIRGPGQRLGGPEYWAQKRAEAR